MNGERKSDCARSQAAQCVRRIPIPPAESLHQDPGVFVIVPGHVRVDGEVVVRHEAEFEQVRKPST